MNRVTAAIEQLLRKQLSFTINDHISVFFDEDTGGHIESEMLVALNEKGEYEYFVSADISFQRIADFVEIFELKTKQDFLNINRKRVWSKFKAAAGWANRLSMTLSPGYTYERIGKNGLVFLYRTDFEPTTVKLDLSNFRTFKDYLDHFKRFHDKVGIQELEKIPRMKEDRKMWPRGLTYV